MTAAMGLKSNPRFMPEVVGGGDEAYVYFPKSVECVASNWRATGVASVNAIDGAALPQPIPIGVTSKSDSWPMNMSVKSSEMHTSITPWATLRFPADPALAGKTLEVRVVLTVTRPAMFGAREFRDFTDVQTFDAKVALSGPKAGEMYKTAWWFAMGGGLFGTTVAGIVLALAAGSFKKKAHKTDIFVPGDDGGDHEDDEEEAPPRGRSAPASPPDDRLRKPHGDEDY